MTRRTTTRKEQPAKGDLLAERLDAPARDALPFANPVVAWSDRDPDALLAGIEACALATIRLERRGREHGDVAELDPARTPRRTRWPRPGTRAFDGLLAERWQAARPIVLPGIAGDMLDEFASEIDEASATHERLTEKGGLAEWFAERTAVLAPDFVPRVERKKLADPERDIARVAFTANPPAGQGLPVRDLWCKSAWLSTHEDDRSLRLRFGHGTEGADDGDRDLNHHRLVAELTSRAIPETAVASANPALIHIVERLAGEPVLFTQGLAYWNAPSGGALFHHDAFAEDSVDGGAFRQFGVCYVQLSGETVWLALSTSDLARRVREFTGALAAGQMPWVRAQLFEGRAAPIAGGFERFQTLLADDDHVRVELARPGCGVLGPVVERAPEFTGLLADRGHAAVLRAGDAILLPNHGYHETCMHSVFCAGDDVAYSISLAMRPDREAPEARVLEEARRRERYEAKRGRLTAKRARGTSRGSRR